MIDSSVLVEVRGLARPCPLCGSSLRLEGHSAEIIDGVRLRVAAVVCAMCGIRRSIYFRLDDPNLH